MQMADCDWVEQAAAWPELARWLSDDAAERLGRDWHFLARPAQLAPAGDWRIWLMMAGRGFGKTRAGAAHPEITWAPRGNHVGPTRQLLVKLLCGAYLLGAGQAYRPMPRRCAR